MVPTLTAAEISRWGEHAEMTRAVLEDITRAEWTSPAAERMRERVAGCRAVLGRLEDAIDRAKALAATLQEALRQAEHRMARGEGL